LYVPNGVPRHRALGADNVIRLAALKG